MTEIPNTLFSETKRKELSANEKIVKKQRDAVKKWKDDLDANVLDIESQNKDHLRDLMINALGYPIDKIKAESGEKNTRLDYSYTPDSGTGGVLFELKSRKKKPFQHQGYDKKEQDTPVDQAIAYIEKNPHISYAIITNFEEFVLITREDIRSQCYHFKFPPKGMNLLDSEIREFIHFFSKDGVENGFIETAKRATIIEENTITTDFYKLYHQTRLMLIHAFNHKNRIEYVDAIKIAQTYLNRLIFLFFAEDNRLIKKRVFSDGILSILNSGDLKEKTIIISSYIQTLFSWMDEGSDEIDNKSGFNGEFFKEPIDKNAFFYDFQIPEFFEDVTKKVQVPTKIKLNKENQIAIDRYDGKINPIIINFLKMASYNFKHKDSDDIKDDDEDSIAPISVSILGHIFEQSIGDLEELQTKEISQRKKEGVFYTPDYITEYICKNTIIPYLSKNESTEPHHLVVEYKENLKELEDKIDQIKILDPACGSGAFLVKAVDVLISIIDEIQNFKYGQGASIISKKGKKESGVAKQTTFDKEHETDIARRKLIQNNIYGVDLNPESVEITKLSLFLKIATKNKRLIGLSQRIRVGNSIVNDTAFDIEKSFDWKTEFAEILDDNIPGKGFDIIIGNPPYVRQEYLKEIKPYLKNHFESYDGQADLYVYFLEKGMSLLKDDGFLGVIVSNKWLRTGYGTNLRNYMDKFYIEKFINFGDLQVFSDATTYPCIMMMRKNNEKNSQIPSCNVQSLDFTDFTSYVISHSFSQNQNNLDERGWIIENPKIQSILTKIKNQSTPLKEYVDEQVYRGILTGLTKAFVINEETKNELIKKDAKSQEIIKPFLTGKEIRPYGIDFQNNYIILTKIGVDIKRYPAILDWLSNFKEEAKKRWDKGDHWYELRSCTYYDQFAIPKIVYGVISVNPRFTLDYDGYLVNNANFFIPIDDKHLLGILNSNLGWFLITNTCTRVKGGYQLIWEYFGNTPIPKKTDLHIEKLVEKVLFFQSNVIKEKKIVETRIKNEFNVNAISNKLNKFNELTLNEFELQLKKLTKSEISLTKLDEWQEYFLMHKNKINSILLDIQQIEHDINDRVYALFDITKEERKAIEFQLNEI